MWKSIGSIVSEKSLGQNMILRKTFKFALAHPHRVLQNVKTSTNCSNFIKSFSRFIYNSIKKNCTKESIFWSVKLEYPLNVIPRKLFKDFLHPIKIVIRRFQVIGQSRPKTESNSYQCHTKILREMRHNWIRIGRGEWSIQEREGKTCAKYMQF